MVSHHFLRAQWLLNKQLLYIYQNRLCVDLQLQSFFT